MATEQEQTFEITRVFDAPRDTVWRAWTEVDHLKKWWGPTGFTMKKCTLDLRPSGLFHFGMAAPDGSEMWGKWTFREVTPQERLVFVNSFSDEAGSTTQPPFADQWPAEMLSTAVFSEEGGTTTVHLAAKPINASEEEIATFIAGFGSMQQGFGGTFTQLDEYLKTL